MQKMNRNQLEAAMAARKKSKKEKKGNSTMCKIMGFSGITSATRDKAWLFAKEAAKHLCERDKDGFGYAVATPEGALFGERWVDPEDAFKNRDVIDVEEQALLTAFGGTLIRPRNYESFGVHERAEASAFILHARMATCAKGLHNTHPFVSQNTALVHNGVITNPAQIGYISSTCDSESILKSYLAAGVADDPSMLQLVADELTGTYACLMLGTDSEGTAYMDVFRDDRNTLCMSYIEDLGAYVFCTNPEIIKDTCRALGFTIQYTYWLYGNVFIRMDVVSGVPIMTQDFESFGYKGPTSGSGGTGTTSNFHSNHTGGTATDKAANLGGPKEHGANQNSDDSFSEEDWEELMGRNGWAGYAR